MKSNTLSVAISKDKLLLNEGQIEGLPKNPRFIRDTQFEKLKKSIEDFPEMLKLRELIVYPFEDKYVVIAGNMRLRAGQELGLKEFPCKVLPSETTVERLKEITIKDNNSFGEWDMDDLANEWDKDELSEWGIETYDNYDSNIDIDSLFQDGVEPKENEQQDSIMVIIPADSINLKAEIKETIKAALKGYNITIK